MLAGKTESKRGRGSDIVEFGWPQLYLPGLALLPTNPTNQSSQAFLKPKLQFTLYIINCGESRRIHVTLTESSFLSCCVTGPGCGLTR